MQALTAAISDFALTACKIGYSLLIYFANKMQRFSNTKVGSAVHFGKSVKAAVGSISLNKKLLRIKNRFRPTALAYQGGCSKI